MTSLVTYQSFLDKRGLLYHEYQWEGLEWCLRNENTEIMRGGIIADEMGLGKTLLMISTISFNLMMKTLIVVPPVLMNQWREQSFMLTGHKPLVYHCLYKKRILFEDLIQSPIVLTTYHCISISPKDPIARLLHKVKWNRVIFDEAHHMRNRNTRVHKAGCVVRAKHKWLVTGTPIQNGISDFYGLCSVLGLSREFYTKRENVGDIARELILKRTKTDVGLILPELTKHVVNVEWGSPEERMLASDIHAHLEFSKVAIRDENSFKSLGIHHFAMLQRAQQACINMDLLANSVKALKELGILDDSEFIESALKYQSKLDKVKETILGRMDNGRGKLVFCHYLGEMDSLVSAMRSSGMNVGRFDGKTSQSARSEMLTDSSLDAIVLQIKTGCEGLNLQRFSEVYFVSPDWNPAIEDQAVARCHRIGQENGTDVFSFRMESFDGDAFTRTMDMYTRDLQQSKRLQMRAIEAESDGSNGEEMEEVCAICLEAQHKNTCHHLECKHYFHRDCLGKWFKRDRTCPLCRAD